MKRIVKCYVESVIDGNQGNSVLKFYLCSHRDEGNKRNRCYKILGLPFYNNALESEFKVEFEELVL